MRFVITKYACDGLSAVETTDDGSSVVQEFVECADNAQPISAYLEGTCDDTEEGVNRLLAALAWLRDEVEKRRQGFAGKNARKKSKRSPA